jgi:hypothetical protein
MKQQYGGHAKSAFNLPFDDDCETTGVRHRGHFVEIINRLSSVKNYTYGNCEKMRFEFRRSILTQIQKLCAKMDLWLI